MANLWNSSNNTVLATLTERITAEVPLPIENYSDLEIIKIAGELPAGMRISGNKLIGTPFEVVRNTNYSFVLRATTSNDFEDITFNIIVTGPDDPVWITNPDELPVGYNNRFFVLDNEIIDYQLIAIDNDTSAGSELEYFIADGDGELPPGIKLTTDGRLVGVVEPLLALDKLAGNGGYDSNPYGEYPIDFATFSDNGFGTFFYDSDTYDFSFSTQSLKKLNRHYRFAVTATDGDTDVRREFEIYVVGDDFLRADNTVMKVENGIFTADNTHIRTPVWVTPANLGYKRANNYVTLYLDIIDDYTLSGNVVYSVDDFNSDGSLSELPPGLELDTLNGEITGYVPYQPAVTEEYNFTIRATRFTGDIDYAVITGQVYEDVLAGSDNFKIFKLPVGTNDGINDIADLAGQIIELGGRNYRILNIDNTQEEYETVYLGDTLRPKFFVKTINEVNPGVDYFYVESLDYQTRSLVLNSKLNYSDTEQYTVESIHPYIQWTITSSLDDLEINWNTVSETETITDDDDNIITETLADKIKRVFEAETDLTVEVSEATTSSISFIAAVSANTSLSRIENIIVSPGNAATYTKGAAGFERIKLDLVLERSFQQGQTISWALLKDDTFEKLVSTSANEDINNPSTAKTFTLKVLGEVDSTINFTTPADLGSIRANYVSTLKINATTTVTESPLVFEIVAGKLPNGLTLAYDGEIFGKPRQFAEGDLLGLTRFDNRTTSFDGANTTFDRQFTFTIKAQDRFGYSAVEQEFTLTVIDPDDLLYSNLYIAPLIEPEMRDEYRRFVSNPEIFPPNAIYRPNDPEFGIQTSVKMLAFAGIETKEISDYVSAIAKNHTKKRFRFGEIKTAVAKEPGTNNIVYEVVYVEIIDPAQAKSGKTATQFTAKNAKRITADSVQYTMKDDVTRYRSGTSQIEVATRDGNPDTVFLDNNRITVSTRDGDIIQPVDNNDIDVTLNSGGETNIAPTSTDSEPWRFRPDTNTLKADSNAVKVSQSKDNVKYISNLQNMQDRLREVGAEETEFLPLWMRTLREGTDIGTLTYVPAVPLAYCKPGRSEEVLINIQNRDFDLKLIDFTADRYIIDSTEGNSNEQYIVFANYSFNV